MSQSKSRKKVAISKQEGSLPDARPDIRGTTKSTNELLGDFEKDIDLELDKSARDVLVTMDPSELEVKLYDPEEKDQTITIPPSHNRQIYSDTSDSRDTPAQKRTLNQNESAEGQSVRPLFQTSICP